MPYDMENIEIQFEEETKDECATSSNNISVIKADFAIQSNISDTIDEDEEQQQAAATTTKATKDDNNKVWSRFSSNSIKNFPKHFSDLSSNEKKVLTFGLVIFIALLITIGAVFISSSNNNNSSSSYSSIQPPSDAPTTSVSPTQSPSTSYLPTLSPTMTNPYYFGEEFITVPSLGIEMSTGLTAKLIARTGRKVQYANGDESTIEWHTRSDAAGIIELEDGKGYVYMSNSEEDDGNGGVYGLYFNAKGEIVDYRALLTGTTDNCGGGLTPWNTWVSCEEESGVGQCWQVDPYVRAERTVLGGRGGNYESVAVDDRVHDRPVFFTTEDEEDGALRRFVATQHGWNALHSEGEHSYLHLLDDGTFEWTTSLSTGRDSAERYYPNTEGISVHEGNVYFMSKERQRLIILNQDSMTWTSEESGKKFYGEGSFGGQPDQTIFGPTRKYIYFTEEGSSTPGVYARFGKDGTYFTLFQAISGGIHDDDETIGIALSPDNKRFYAGFQVSGYIFEFMREDGLAFE